MKNDGERRAHDRTRGGPAGGAVASVVLWLWLSIPVLAETDTLGQLAGSYVGVSVDQVVGTITAAPVDVRLEVSVRGEHVVLRWQSLATPEPGLKHYYEVVFRKSRRPHIYLAGMRCDVFGKARPLDPGRGEPYMWAHVGGDELTLYTMAIADDGSHDLSSYRYRLDGERMTLEFKQILDDRPVREIRAVLRRATGEVRFAAPDTDQAVQQHAAVGCG